MCWHGEEFPKKREWHEEIVDRNLALNVPSAAVGYLIPII